MLQNVVGLLGGGLSNGPPHHWSEVTKIGKTAMMISSHMLWLWMLWEYCDTICCYYYDATTECLVFVKPRTGRWTGNFIIEALFGLSGVILSDYTETLHLQNIVEDITCYIYHLVMEAQLLHNMTSVLSENDWRCLAIAIITRPSTVNCEFCNNFTVSLISQNMTACSFQSSTLDHS